jgi:nucleoside-diphosphate-sugar epimerase
MKSRELLMDEMVMENLIVWGAGELGGRVAKLAADAGYSTRAYTKSTTRHHDLERAGIGTYVGDPEKLDAGDSLVLSIAGTQQLEAAMDRLSNQEAPKRVILTSSTGYYHGCSGSLDPDSPAGLTPRAQAISALETKFRNWTGERGVVLRLGGLYRQGRGPLSALRKSGQVPAGTMDRVLPLIHYDDAARATFEAIRHQQPRSTYIAVTPPCPTRREFYLAASVILQLNLPNFDRSLDHALTEYDVHALKTDLLSEPQHPRWQEALIP